MICNELRIGNYVNTPIGFRKVFDINIYNEVGVRVLWDEKNMNISTTYEYNEISPIKISADILIKSGFEKHVNSNEYWNHYALPNGFCISEALHSEPSAGVKKGLFYEGEEYTELEFLHWLQNFYFFSCNGIELDINFNI